MRRAFALWHSRAACLHVSVPGLSTALDASLPGLAGPGCQDKDAASVRANVCVPSVLPIYYFEVEVISKGREGYIGVGFCTADVNMDRLPGWEPQSYGYHGDDGNAFRSDGKGRKYGPRFAQGTLLHRKFVHELVTLKPKISGPYVGYTVLAVAEWFSPERC